MAFTATPWMRSAACEKWLWLSLAACFTCQLLTLPLLMWPLQEASGGKELRYALKNSFGFGGTNASLLLARYEP
jgi:hypothetical protein